MKLSIVKNVHCVEPNDFEPSDHWYPRVLNSNIHPLVSRFLNLSNELITERYCRLTPKANKEVLLSILNYQPELFRWAGTDMMYITNLHGERKLTLIETNSCPSGQKSMPLLDENIEMGGYKRLIERTFKPMAEKSLVKGGLAVIYDKNPMENIGYAATIADVFQEDVYLAKFDKEDPNPPVKFEDGIMFVHTSDEEWTPIRASFRYVTQEPWNRLPPNLKTVLLNPIEACLAGGRNKSVASKAYTAFNQKFEKYGLEIPFPITKVNVHKSELKDFFEQMGGSIVVKVPESNAGQGVYTVTNERELEATLSKLPDDNQKYIVQELIAANSNNNENQWYHVGTVPDFKGRSWAFDIRMMLYATEEGMRPLAAYSRRTRFPLNEALPEGTDSWEVYGTNLSVKSEKGWEYDDERLLTFDLRNFGILGLGLNELILGFVQSCMAIYAVDKNALSIKANGSN
jgi:hypothetical protein